MQYCNDWPRTKCVTDWKIKIFSYGECISMSIDVFLLRWVNPIHIVCLKFIVPMIIRLSSLFSIVCNADCVSSDYTCRIPLANRVDIFDLSYIDLDYVLVVLYRFCVLWIQDISNMILLIVFWYLLSIRA